jgi:hypothetical protein
MGRSIRCRWPGVTVLLAALVFLSGCTENANLFTSLDETGEPSLETVAAGSVISPLTPLSIQLAYPDEDMSRATSLMVQLVDPEGDVVGELAFEEDQLMEPVLPEVELPSPEPGPYLLVVEALRGDELLFRDERQIFVLTESPRIRSVSVYPSQVGTYADAIAVADITSVSATRPYLKWYFQSALIGEGYVEEGAAKVVFSPGENIGVHGISVDLYPWGPDEGVRVTDRTTISAGTDVFVRADTVAREVRENVLVQYPLNGRLEPTVDRLSREFLPAEVDDAVVLDVRDERLGYSIPPEAGLLIPYDVVPPEGELRRLVFRLDQSKSRGEVTVSSIETNGETPILDLRVGISGDGSIRTALALEEPFQQELNGPGTTNGGWGTLSILLVRRENSVWAVPEIPGRIPRVFAVTDRWERDFSSVTRLAYRGEGSLLVESIEVILPAAGAEIFSPSFDSLLYHEPASPLDPTARVSRVDLRREDVVLSLPEDHYFLWTTDDGESRFFLRRDGNTVTVYDPGPSARPGQVTGTIYPVLASRRLQGDTVQVQQGQSFAVSTDGVITVPASDGSTFTVFSVSLSDRSGPAFLATVRK